MCAHKQASSYRVPPLCELCGPHFVFVSPPVLSLFRGCTTRSPGPHMSACVCCMCPLRILPCPCTPSPPSTALQLCMLAAVLSLSCRCLCTGLPSPREDVLDAAVARAAAKRRKPKPEFAWGGTNPFDSQYAKP